MNKDWVEFHPRQYKYLINMEAPTNIGALMELLHGEIVP